MLKYEVHEADASKGYNFPFILVNIWYKEKMLIVSRKYHLKVF